MFGLLRSKSKRRYPVVSYGPDEVIFDQLVHASGGRSASRIEIKTGLFADKLNAEYGQFVIFEINGVQTRKVQAWTSRDRRSAAEAAHELGRKLVSSLKEGHSAGAQVSASLGGDGQP